jgi:hypothetical protein
MDTSEKYRLMIMFAVATMHFYRNDITVVEGENLGEFAERNKAVMSRVFDEALNTFNYELSHRQIGQAIQAYLCPPCSMADPAYKPVETTA